MHRWSIEYYENNRSKKPVKEYIDGLAPSKQANIYRVINNGQGIWD